MGQQEIRRVRPGGKSEECSEGGNGVVENELPDVPEDETADEVRDEEARAVDVAPE